VPVPSDWDLCTILVLLSISDTMLTLLHTISAQNTLHTRCHTHAVGLIFPFILYPATHHSTASATRFSAWTVRWFFHLYIPSRATATTTSVRCLDLAAATAMQLAARSTREKTRVATVAALVWAA